MNLHENKDAFIAAIQLASSPIDEGGLGIKQIYIPYTSKDICSP